MIHAIVFSKDRAMQLDALLRSIDKHAAGLFGRVTVIYTTSSPLHAQTYAQLILDQPWVRWWKEAIFATDVRAAMSVHAEHVCFLVDDDVFYRDNPTDPVVRVLSDEACYSLRLADMMASDGRRWPWPRCEGDYGYPLALDGHIYPRELLTPHLDFDFANPTQLEAHLASRAAEILLPDRPYMAGCACLVGIPANRVSESSGCAYDGRLEWHPDALAHRYLEGERIDLDAMDWSLVDGAHTVVPYVFA